MRAFYTIATATISLALGAATFAHEPTALDGSPAGIVRTPGVPSEAAWVDVEACEAGDAAGCYRLAERYHGGNGVQRDNPWSVELTRTACAGELARACHDLGARHLLGEYVEQDFEQGLSWILRSCELDDGLACSYAATLIDEGISPAEPVATEDLRTRACGLGFLASCGDAGVPRESSGVEAARLPANAEQEVIDLAHACDLGFMGACGDLADRWESGQGVTADSAVATELWEAACDWGLLGACRSLGR